MNFSLLELAAHALYAQAQSAPGSPQGPSQLLLQMGPMLLLFGGIMYFFIFRPQQKRDRERRDMLASMSKGDKVITTGGICGEVVGMSETSVVLRVDDSCKIEFVKSAIAQVAPRETKESK